MNPTDPSASLPPPPMEEPDDFKAMMIGGAVIFVIAFIPYSFMLCCLPQIGGAMLAVHLFTKWHKLTVSVGHGIKLGILSALLGSMVAWVVMMAIRMLFGYQFNEKEVEQLMLSIFSKLNNPEVLDKMKEGFEKARAEGVTLMQLLIGLFSILFNSAISGLIGGSIGAAIFKRGPARVP